MVLLCQLGGVSLILGCPEPSGTSSFAGGQSGDEGGGQTLPEQGAAGETPAPYCTHTASDGPDSVSRNFACHSDTLDLSWRPGQATPPGNYRCECDRNVVQIEDAINCEKALETGCKIDLSAPLFCRDNGLNAGCWPVPEEPEAWNCQCGDGAELVEAKGSECLGVVFDVCAAGCASDLGQCSTSADAVGFDCTCEDETTASWAGVRDCTRALSLSCRSVCETTSGHCNQRSNGFECACQTGDNGDPAMATTVEYIDHEQGYGHCPLSLEIACGYPLAGESCEEVEDYGVRLSCTADGEGDWECECPLPVDCVPTESTDAPGVAIPVPGQREIGVPPEGLLDEPRNCWQAIGAYCGCQ